MTVKGFHRTQFAVGIFPFRRRDHFGPDRFRVGIPTSRVYPRPRPRVDWIHPQRSFLARTLGFEPKRRLSESRMLAVTLRPYKWLPSCESNTDLLFNRQGPAPAGLGNIKTGALPTELYQRVSLVVSVGSRDSGTRTHAHRLYSKSWLKGRNSHFLALESRRLITKARVSLRCVDRKDSNLHLPGLTRQSYR